MPNLQPDTSVLIPKQQQGGFGSMSLLDLLRASEWSQTLQSQQSMTDALKASTNPNTGQVDYDRAAQTFQALPGFKDPGQFQSLTEAARAQTTLNQYRVGETLKGLGSLITKSQTKGGATLDDWALIEPWLLKSGVPADYTDMVKTHAVAHDGKFDPRVLTTIYNMISQNSGLHTVKTLDPATGKEIETPIGAIMQQQAQGPAAGTGGAAIGGTGGATPGPIGSYQTSIPPQEAGTRDLAAKQAAVVQGSGPRVAQMRGALQTLDDLSAAAPAGGGADFSVRWSRFMNEIGLPELATLKPSQVAAGEQYTKIANRIVTQMQEGNASTNEWLHNYQGGNPSLILSREGRGGVVHWLQGNNDVENLIASQWQKWLDAHPGQQGQHFNWLRSKDGMNIGAFDPRVFQYARMTPEERKTFRADMTGDQRQQFQQHYRDYENRGWIKEAQGG